MPWHRRNPAARLGADSLLRWGRACLVTLLLRFCLRPEAEMGEIMAKNYRLPKESRRLRRLAATSWNRASPSCWS